MLLLASTMKRLPDQAVWTWSSARTVVVQFYTSSIAWLVSRMQARTTQRAERGAPHPIAAISYNHCCCCAVMKHVVYSLTAACLGMCTPHSANTSPAPCLCKWTRHQANVQIHHKLKIPY